MIAFSSFSRSQAQTAKEVIGELNECTAFLLEIETDLRERWGITKEGN